MNSAMVGIILLIAGVYLVLYYYKDKFGIDETHLPKDMFDDPNKKLEPAYAKFIESPKQNKKLPFAKILKFIESKIVFNYLRRNLIKAGSPMGLLEFLAFKFLFLLILPLVGVIFLKDKFNPGSIILVGSALGFFLPDLWLRRKILKRQLIIRKELPNIIDLLTLCVSGGLDFMLAVNRVLKDLKPSPLTRELADVYRQTQMGKARKDALKDFAWRVDMPEVHSFVRTLVQADRMGSPIAEALRLQSEELRVLRFQRGEAMALKAPVKLLLPLFLFILPVVLIIVGGPIILQFVRGNAF